MSGNCSTQSWTYVDPLSGTVLDVIGCIRTLDVVPRLLCDSSQIPQSTECTLQNKNPSCSTGGWSSLDGRIVVLGCLNQPDSAGAVRSVCEGNLSCFAEASTTSGEKTFTVTQFQTILTATPTESANVDINSGNRSQEGTISKACIWAAVGTFAGILVLIAVGAFYIQRRKRLKKQEQLLKKYRDSQDPSNSPMSITSSAITPPPVLPPMRASPHDPELHSFSAAPARFSPTSSDDEMNSPLSTSTPAHSPTKIPNLPYDEHSRTSTSTPRVLSTSSSPGSQSTIHSVPRQDGSPLHMRLKSPRPVSSNTPSRKQRSHTSRSLTLSPSPTSRTSTQSRGNSWHQNDYNQDEARNKHTFMDTERSLRNFVSTSSMVKMLPPSRRHSELSANIDRLD